MSLCGRAGLRGGSGPGAPSGRLTPSQPNAIAPSPSQPTRPSLAKRRDMTAEDAREELIERKLITPTSTNNITFNSLINILLAFTGKEDSPDGLGEPWELVHLATPQNLHSAI
ncbi:hypothetical protein BDV93DRAFT_562769 [Ceratobasidium sp. AG-I]|nr:hypothetical protein BDV93DRAFT_562769 [Ceratobasidium sp. AG-I]